jgi:archaeosine synthase
MKFGLNKRDGPARIGEFEVDKKNVKTPNILYINTIRFKAPAFAELLISNNAKDTDHTSLNFSCNLIMKLINESIDEKYIVNLEENFKIDEKIIKSNIKFYIISNAKQLFKYPKKFLEFIIKLREKVGYQKLIYLPSIGYPVNLSLLTYLGIDLFDSAAAIIAARENTLLFENGNYQKEELEELPCNCPACSKINKPPIELKFQDILNHNYYSLITEIKQIRNAISRGEIRNLVENRVRVNPHLTTILKNLDRYHYDFLEKRTPIVNKGKIIATTKESCSRPEIIRFQKRIINQYIKPNSAKILLLLPCSAKKPYSDSKSHKMFKEQIFSTKNPYIIHEVIITSPLGIVPRELENIYPASSYDIPVTGVWEEYEKVMIKKLLQSYLKKNSYNEFILHLPPELNEFISPILKNEIITCIDHPTSQDSLDKLKLTLNSVVKKYDKINIKDRAKEEMQSILLYQFGEKITSDLLRKTIIKGRYPNRKIFENNVQLGMTTKERGLLSLTLQGALKLNKSDRYYVDIYDDFDIIGSIFAPGIKDSDNSIRIGDEVLVKRKKKVIAVGVAQMNGDEMIESSYGEAVKVRHRI